VKPLDVRDMYAMAALQGLLASNQSGVNASLLHEEHTSKLGEIFEQQVQNATEVAMLIADEMMRLREKEPK